jgi:3-oxoacyl-[acyl-carrier-protein] synthase II
LPRPRRPATASPPRRVVITGIGAITPIGFGREGLWEGVRRGASAVRLITRFDPRPFRSHIAAEIDGFDPMDFMEAQRARRLDRYAQLAIAASRQALEDAGRCREVDDATAVYLGSALGGIAFAEEQHTRFLSQGSRAVPSMLALSVFGGAGATNVAMEFGLRGPVLGNANSCASGLIAIGEAFRLLRSGAGAIALAGGVEAPLAPLTFGAFALIKALSTCNDAPERASRPFDRARDGFVMGEGAAVLVLEELEHARAAGARPYAEVLGYGLTNDAYHMTAPLPSGEQAARAMTLALAEAGLAPTAVDYVNAHATGTPLGDAAEARAIRLAFGDHAGRLPVSGTKGLYGHPLGASGAVEAAITALALDRAWLPPTTNLVDPDPDCAIAHVPPGGLAAPIAVAITNSFGFGGINASLVLRRWDPTGSAGRSRA